MCLIELRANERKPLKEHQRTHRAFNSAIDAGKLLLEKGDFEDAPLGNDLLLLTERFNMMIIALGTAMQHVPADHPDREQIVATWNLVSDD